MHPDNNFDTLMDRYRLSCELPESGANFMPELWARIEAKRSRSRLFERAARSLVGVAVGVSFILGAFLLLPSPQPSAFYSGSFVEQLATENVTSNGTFFEPVRLELVGTESHVEPLPRR